MLDDIVPRALSHTCEHSPYGIGKPRGNGGVYSRVYRVHRAGHVRTKEAASHPETAATHVTADAPVHPARCAGSGPLALGGPARPPQWGWGGRLTYHGACRCPGRVCRVVGAREKGLVRQEELFLGGVDHLEVPSILIEFREQSIGIKNSNVSQLAVN